MPRPRSFQIIVLLFSLAIALPPAVGQVVVATVPVGILPYAVAVNPATNQIYVANATCGTPPCPSAGTVTVINGATNNPTNVNAGVFPSAVAVNPVTNKIYVANYCGNDVNCSSAGTVTVIDGATNNTTTVTVGAYPFALALNRVTNQIYVANNCGNDLTCFSAGTVTVIDGASNNTTTVGVGNFPTDVEINTVTNQIYVVNNCGNDNNCGSDGTVTVIDGGSNNTATVSTGVYPYVAAINSVTNQIYVPNNCGNDLTCSSAGTVTAINGATNNTSTIIAGAYPGGVAVDAVTNNIYVVNNCGTDLSCNSPGTVTVINGLTNNTQTVNIGNINTYNFPSAVAVDAVTNQIYVPNFDDNTVTVIDGATNNTTPVNVGNGPFPVAVNPATDEIYVGNYVDGTASVISGPNNPTPLQFVPVIPCRLVDTRKSGGPIQGGNSRNFPPPQLGGCNIPGTAAAYSLNVTVVPAGRLGYLTIWPTGEDQPVVSTMNSLDGRIKANAAIVAAGYAAAVGIYVSNTTDVVLDIDGYFTIPGNTLQFYPLTPCRVLDTRNANGDLGGPYLNGKQERDFPVLESSCNIPSSAQAYSMNFTVVPVGGQPLGYLTVWAQGAAQPVVSTLNNLTATIVANAAIVPAGTGGGIATYPDENTQLVVDIDGYFAPAGTGGLSLYTGSPCRVIDTRKVGNGQPFGGELTVDVVDSVCAPPSTAQAYVFNATVVPQGGLGYLTLWPDTENQPGVSTLNAGDGAITSNMAIVPNINGKTDAYASGITQLILDISSYFAP